MADPARVLIVIPSRFASSRFPGKPLVQLRGAGGIAKPLVQWTWEAAIASGAGDVVVATDDARIADVVNAFGGQIVMTSPENANGTERCAEVATKMAADLIVNLQGDAPLIPAPFITGLVDAWQAERSPVLTAFVECDDLLERRLLADAAEGRVGGTTVVTNAASRAMYFSKRVIPYRDQRSPALKFHVGLYAYTPAALAAYAAHPPCQLELAEGLEQLRFLDMGYQIAAVRMDAPGGGLWEVNNPADVALVEKGLADHDSASLPARVSGPCAVVGVPDA